MNIIEYTRQEAIKNLFAMQGFNNSFSTWKPLIEKEINPNPDFFKILNLGDSLADIFKSTGQSGRSQSSVSSGGKVWEGLACWYLNLCLVGSKTVVIKQAKKLVPSCVADAVTVNYGSFVSNTESDLIAITFPNESEFMNDVSNFEDSNGKFNFSKELDSLCKKYFDKLEVGIIQCKTNWNDNAQIPMLWEIVYSSTRFEHKSITIGKNGFSMKGFKKFFYSFVTVPSGEAQQNYSAGHLPVKRVYNLSGGNFWGKSTRSGVAHSIKEIFNKNFSNSWTYGSQQKDVESSLRNKKNLNYFNLSL